ncbi:M16 family metallopeptidase [Rodentibacter caecimuris]|uniref:Peptidase M16 n=1 Tax=Rodentibacter caecimuris TaxID=1796644 RepID=A0ABX3KYU7_9PAST|nr:peptidase M16 [Rodentibacter heylii]
MYKIRFFLTALFAVFILNGCNSFTKRENLSHSDELRTGKLENGLNYLILQNPNPRDRVYIRLVVNAGSMHEDDDQRGVAHIVEHMAFNGSKRFPQNQIIGALEKLGMKFARDINAFTDFENTVYVLNIAKNDLKTLSLAFDVLDEWMNHLTILPVDLDSERGIVLEEWRSRLGPMLRLGDKKSALEMAGSRYVLRDPIGDVNIIKYVPRQRVYDFYQKWYRPDNMSLVVVGDVNPEQVESLMAQKLSFKNDRTLSSLENVNFNIPIVDGLRLASVAEKGIHTPAIELSFMRSIQEKNTFSEYKQELIQQIMGRLINLRFQEWEKKYPNLIQSGNFYQSHLGKETEQQLFTLQLNDEDYKTAIQELFKFIAQIRQYGFTEQEFKGELARLEKLNERQAKISLGSLRLADDLVTIAANNQIYLGQKDKYYLNKKLLNEILLIDVNRAFNNMSAIQAKLLLITQKYPQKKLAFSQQDVLNWWNEKLQEEQSYWQQEKLEAAIPTLNLTAGKIIAKKYWEKGNITEYQLSNGSRLIYHYTDKTPNQVHFKAMTKGGLRSVSKEKYHWLRSAVTLVDDSGIGVISQPQLVQLFGENPLVLATVIDDERQGFTAAGKAQSLEDILKLFRLKLQSATIDKTVFDKYKQENIDSLTQLDAGEVFSRQVSSLRFPTIPTAYGLDKKQLLSFNADELSTIYQQILLTKTDFTYFVVGDIPQSAVENLAENYLANVEVKTQERQYYSAKAITPQHPLRIRGLTEPRAEVELYFIAEEKWQAENDYLLDILGDIVQEQLRLDLREKESGIYSVSSWFTQDKNTNQIEARIDFSCAPERTEFLIQAADKVLNHIVSQGVPEKLLQKKIAEKQNEIKQQFDNALSILDMIEYSFLHSNSPDLIYRYQKLNQIATKENIEKLAHKILTPQGRFQAVLSQ